MEKKIFFQIGKDCGEMTLRDVLRKEMGLSAREISRAKFRENGICVNQVRRRIDSRVKGDDCIEVILEEAGSDSRHLLPLEGEPVILYQDEDLCAVNKPAGMPVHPSHGHYRDTLANLIHTYYQSRGVEGVVRSVGRLDLDTSGVVLFARNRWLRPVWHSRGRKVCFTKEYLAVCKGSFSKTQGVIEQSIGKQEDSLIKMQVCQEGKRALTKYQVVAQRDQKALVRLRIATGRTHQIRVHMAWMGHPLLGDKLYGEASAEIGRTALHAWRAKLHQPFTGKVLQIQAPMPPDMYTLVEGWPEIGVNSNNDQSKEFSYGKFDF